MVAKIHLVLVLHLYFFNIPPSAGQRRICELPESAEDAGLKIIDIPDEEKIISFCYEGEQLTAFEISVCKNGEWNPSIYKNCSEIGALRNGGTMLPNRFRRSPNVGKYEALKRHEKVQRKIKEGLLSTRIEPNTPSVVRVHPGSRAFLLCRVQNLGTNSVVWSFQDRVISIDILRIAADRRFLASHDEATGTWMLEVRGIRPLDEGNYICQVNTKPPLQHTVALQVVPIGVPLLPPLPDTRKSNDTGRTTAVEELAANISSLWQEVSRINEWIQQHDQSLEFQKLRHHDHPHHQHQHHSQEEDGSSNETDHRQHHRESFSNETDHYHHGEGTYKHGYHHHLEKEVGYYDGSEQSDGEGEKSPGDGKSHDEE